MEKPDSRVFHFFYSIPLVAALSPVLAKFQVMGLNGTGYVWPAVFLAAVMIVFTLKKRVYFPMGIWGPWTLYVVFVLLWSDFDARYAMQNVFQITTPFAVGMAASVAFYHRSFLKKYMEAYRHGFVALVILFFLFVLMPKITRHPFFSIWQPTGSRTYALVIVITTVFLVCDFQNALWKRAAYWGACVFMAFLSGGRMATFSTLVVWLLFPFSRSHWPKELMQKALAVFVILLVGVGLFYTPHFQSRFFKSGHGTLSDLLQGKFQSAGRFDLQDKSEVEPLWNQAMDKARPYLLAGGGSGYLQDQMQKPVNDYLRVLADYGLIGLTFFLGAMFLQLADAFAQYNRVEDPTLQQAYATLYAGLLILLLVTLTENSLTYCLYLLNPIFALIGAVYGVRRRASVSPLEGLSHEGSPSA